MYCIDGFSVAQFKSEEVLHRLHLCSSGLLGSRGLRVDRESPKSHQKPQHPFSPSLPHATLTLSYQPLFT